MRNVNDAGMGFCPSCGHWLELTRYHPRDKHLPRKQKDKYCGKCVHEVSVEREPFYRIKKAISNHRVMFKEGDYSFKDLMHLHKTQGGQCAYCSDSIPYEFSIEHVIPKKFGGRNLLINILLVCNSCNSAKQHLEPFFFVRRKRYKLRERIIHKMRDAYDHHAYECPARCEDCRGEQNQFAHFCGPCKVGATVRAAGAA